MFQSRSLITLLFVTVSHLRFTLPAAARPQNDATSIVVSAGSSQLLDGVSAAQGPSSRPTQDRKPVATAEDDPDTLHAYRQEAGFAPADDDPDDPDTLHAYSQEAGFAPADDDPDLLHAYSHEAGFEAKGHQKGLADVYRQRWEQQEEEEEKEKARAKAAFENARKKVLEAHVQRHRVEQSHRKERSIELEAKAKEAKRKMLNEFRMKSDGYRVALDDEAKDNDEYRLTPAADDKLLTRAPDPKKHGPYDKLEVQMREEEKIIFSPDFDITRLAETGSKAFESNKQVQKQMAKYVDSLEKLSAGARAVTDKTFEFHRQHADNLEAAMSMAGAIDVDKGIPARTWAPPPGANELTAPIPPAPIPPAPIPPGGIGHVVVPDGVKPGQFFSVGIGDGKVARVACPDNVSPGQTMTFRTPTQAAFNATVTLSKAARAWKQRKERKASAPVAAGATATSAMAPAVRSSKRAAGAAAGAAAAFHRAAWSRPSTLSRIAAQGTAPSPPVEHELLDQQVGSIPLAVNDPQLPPAPDVQSEQEEVAALAPAAISPLAPRPSGTGVRPMADPVENLTMASAALASGAASANAGQGVVRTPLLPSCREAQDAFDNSVKNDDDGIGARWQTCCERCNNACHAPEVPSDPYATLSFDSDGYNYREHTQTGLIAAKPGGCEYK